MKNKYIEVAMAYFQESTSQVQYVLQIKHMFIVFHFGSDKATLINYLFNKSSQNSKDNSPAT